MDIEPITVLLNFNDSPKCSNGELQLHANETKLFSNQAHSDLEDFGSQGTLVVTNMRIGWVSTDGFKAFECPPDLLGVYGKSGNEMFLQIMSEPALSFNFTFSSDEIVSQLEQQLEICLNQQSSLNDVDNPMNNDIQIFSQETASAMPTSEFNDLPLATSVEDFMSGGWITSENVTKFSEAQLDEINKNINFKVQTSPNPDDQEMADVSAETKEVITFPGAAKSQTSSYTQIQPPANSMQTSQFQQVPLANDMSDFFKGGWITSENVSNFTPEQLNEISKKMQSNQQ